MPARTDDKVLLLRCVRCLACYPSLSVVNLHIIVEEPPNQRFRPLLPFYSQGTHYLDDCDLFRYPKRPGLSLKGGKSCSASNACDASLVMLRSNYSRVLKPAVQLPWNCTSKSDDRRALGVYLGRVNEDDPQPRARPSDYRCETTCVYLG